MSTPVPERCPLVPTPRSTLAAVSRAPADWAQLGRSSVRRRACGMTHAEAAQALAAARAQQQNSRREGPAGAERDQAEVAEWERIECLLATTGGPYNPDDDAYVQDQRAAHAAAGNARLKQEEAGGRTHERGFISRLLAQSCRTGQREQPDTEVLPVHSLP